MSTLSEEIQQQQFESPRQRVLINLLFSAGWAKGISANALKVHGITWQQFNCMRILRGQRGKPTAISTIAERMLDPQSNASRIVDRLYEKGYVSRVNDEKDRRRVNVKLSEQGLELLEKASMSVTRAYQEIGDGMTEAEIMKLSDMLDRFRSTR